METCAQCGKSLFKPSYCKLCGRPFCSKHVAPKNHDCPGLKEIERRTIPRGMVLLTVVGLSIAATAILCTYLVVPRGHASWNGTTIFTEVTDQAGVGDMGSGHGLALADIDNDGDIDIYVVNKNDPNVLYRNEGNGSFTDISTLSGISKTRPGASHGCIALDFDRDGFCDILALSAEEVPILLHNNGDGTFEDYSYKVGFRPAPRPNFISAVDFDEDVDDDIMTSNSDPDDGDADSPNQFYVNTGMGTFVEMAKKGGCSTETSTGPALATSTEMATWIYSPRMHRRARR